MTTALPRPVTPVRAIKIRPGRRLELPDQVATEEPMQILIAGSARRPEPLAVTMRTPGHDFELAAGFVVTEGVTTPEGIVAVDYCEAVDRSDAAARYNHVTVRLSHLWDRSADARYFAASSSCGTCGKTTIDQVTTHCSPVATTEPFPASLIPTLPDRLRQAQKSFDRTGGLHAAGLFDRHGNLCCAREDVGRHNAVDKVLGWMILARRAGRDVPFALALTVSGRVSFEIVQKAAVAGVGLIAAVSAPTSLAVDAAEELGVTMAAFVRGDTFNVYTHSQRLDFDT